MRNFAYMIKIVVLVLTAAGGWLSGLSSADVEYDPEKILQIPHQNILNNKALPGSTGNTGGMSFSIPIKTPPGQGGLKPELSLDYNSSSKANSWVGQGWTLDMGSIQRSSKNKINFNDSDSFSLNGSADLVRRSQWGTGHYGERIEGGFAKYRYLGQYSGWEVSFPDGKRKFYGASGNSRIETGHGVFKWLLNEIRDANGNSITISYDNRGSEVYLSRISYGPSGSRVQFYLESRSDSYPMYDHYKRMALTQRLREIQVFGAGSNAHKYLLQYTYGHNGASLLSSVREYGSNFGSTSLPATTFSYEPGNSFSFNTERTTSTGMTNDLGMTHFGDVNGDGFSDLIRMHSGANVSVFPGDGNGNFGNAVVTVTNAFNREGNIHIEDINGDGRDDLIKIRDTFGTDYMQVYLANNSQDGRFDYVTEEVLHSYTANGQTQLADVNGDGLPDLIEFPFPLSGCAYVRVHISNGNGGFETTIIETPLSQTNDPGRFFMADLNGDGLTDIVKTNPQNYYIYSYIANGDGTFGTGSGSCRDAVATNLGHPTDPGTLHFADLNGDGFSDLISSPVPGSYVHTYFSDGSGGFISAGSINTFQTVNEKGYVHLGDLNGDGLADLVKCHRMGTYIFYYLGDGSGNFLYTGSRNTNNDGFAAVMDVNGDGFSDVLKFKTLNSYVYAYLASGLSGAGVHPDLLVGINNGYGVTSTMTYKLSTAYPDVHKSSGSYPNANLPFVSNFLNSIVVNDGTGNSNITTGFNYRGAHYNIGEKTFLGLARIVRTNPNNTTLTSDYHVADYYLKGRASGANYTDNAGADYNNTTTTWIKLVVESDIQHGVEKGAVWVRPSQENVALVSGGSGASANTAYSYAYTSGYGYPNQITKSGTGASNHIELNTYADQGGWIWRLTNSQLQQDGTTARKTTFQYDGSGNLTHETRSNNSGLDAVIVKSYDSYGNVISERDPNNNTTAFSYLSGTHLNTENFEGLLTTYSNHNQWGEPGQVTDANNKTTVYTYDGYGRVIKEDYPGPGYKTIAHNDTARPRYSVEGVYDGTGTSIDTYTYIDGLDRVLQTSRRGLPGQHITKRYSYDGSGRKWRTTGPFFTADFSYSSASPSDAPYSKTTSFDFIDRPKTIQTPHDNGSIATTRIRYPGFNRTVTDPDGKPTTEGRDFLGRIQTITEANSVTTEYDYNAAGDLTRVKDPLNNIISLTRNWLGHITRQTDPDLGTWNYTYYPGGELHTQTDAKGQTITHAYDNRNRLISKTYTGVATPEAPVALAYDTAANGIGRLYSVTKGDIVIKHEAYNDVGELTQKSTRIGTQDYDIYYDFNPAGSVTSITYPDAYSVDYSYHPGTGLMSSVSAAGPGISISIPSYNNFGKIKQIQYLGFTSTRTYFDKTGRLNSINVPNLMSFEYDYSYSGNVLNKYDTIRNLNYGYFYDDLHRLVKETAVGPFSGVQNRTLDMYYEGSAPHAVTRVSTDQGERTGTYDPNGNLTTGYDFKKPGLFPERRITYTAENMPKTLEYEPQGGPVVSVGYTYDGNSRRVTKQAGTDIVHYIDDIYEIRKGVATKYIFAGNLRLARIKGGTVEYYHKDHLGSSSILSDGNGALVETMAYEPYGTQRKLFCVPENNSVDYAFTDQEWEADTGLYNYDARLYDPVLGRFLSADSIVPSWHDPQALDRYAYARNNPVKYIDPDGHEFRFSSYSDGNSNHHYMPTMDYNTIKQDGIVNTVLINSLYAPAYNFVASTVNEYLNIQQNGGFESFSQMAFLMAGMPEARVAVNGLLKSVGPFVDDTLGKFASKRENPLNGTTFTDKVKRQMGGKDLDHNFPSLIDKQADAAKVKKITGRDGIERTKVKLPGSINGKEGNYSWIIEPDKTINHRQFERLKKK